MRQALVTPLLKKQSLDPGDPKNFRPVSNLSFLSKVIERAVAHQLGKYLEVNKLHHPYQSAYRPHHSVETAMTRVYNDIMCALDQQQGVILVLLDLSAAFDTVDHELLLHRLRTRFGLGGSVIDWLTSYLSDRNQTVVTAGEKSSPKSLGCGVPQGSVLGPVLFSCYICPLSDISKKHDLSTHQYADDSEQYTTFHLPEMASAIEKTEACIIDIRQWMRNSKLKLNDDKTELLLITSPRLRARMPLSTIQMGDIDVHASTSAPNLGCIYDNTMSMEQHVAKICTACYYHLRNISAIRSSLTREAAEKLVHAFISSRLDNCNTLLYSLPSALTSKLQRVQNTAARIVMRASKHHSISHIMKQLHWLPIKQRVQFKIITITWKSLHGLAPSYIDELLTPYVPSRELRSSDRKDLVIPRYRNNYGARAFSSAAPTLWNSLPVNMRDVDCYATFKCQLKTHLFSQAYN